MKRRIRLLIGACVLSAFVLGGVLGYGVYSVTADETVNGDTTETGSACGGNLLWVSDGWNPGEKEKFLNQFTPEYCAKLVTCQREHYLNGSTERCPRPLDY
jgi:hypothetical protein